MDTKGNETMTIAEETRELRRWLREDAQKTSGMVADLHRKIDDNNTALLDKIDVLGDRVSDIDTEGKVNGVKIISLASLVSIIVSGLVFTAFQVLAGG